MRRTSSLLAAVAVAALALTPAVADARAGGGSSGALTTTSRLVVAAGEPLPSTELPVKIVRVEAPSLSVTTSVASYAPGCA